MVLVGNTWVLFLSGGELYPVGSCPMTIYAQPIGSCVGPTGYFAHSLISGLYASKETLIRTSCGFMGAFSSSSVTLGLMPRSVWSSSSNAAGSLTRSARVKDSEKRHYHTNSQWSCEQWCNILQVASKIM